MRVEHRPRIFGAKNLESHKVLSEPEFCVLYLLPNLALRTAVAKKRAPGRCRTSRLYFYAEHSTKII